jgi:hypothetical protein
LLQLLTLKFVELALSLLGQALFALALRKRGTYTSFSLTITLVSRDSTEKTSLRWWRFVGHVDEGSSCFSSKFLLFFCRAIFFVLEASREQPMWSERFCHRLLGGIQLNEGPARIVGFGNGAGIMSRVEDLTPHMTRGNRCGSMRGDWSLRSSASMRDTVFVI